MDRVPIWRLTRTDAGRRVWDGLAARGIKLTRLSLYRTDELDVTVPDIGPDVTLSVRRGATLAAGNRDVQIAPDDWILQARTVDGVVGSIVLSIGREIDISQLDQQLAFDGGYLWALFVAKPYRRRGIATGLVARALQVAANETDTCFALVAPDNRPSQRVFEGLGFTVNGTVTYVGLPGFQWTSDLDALPGVHSVSR